MARGVHLTPRQAVYVEWAMRRLAGEDLWDSPRHAATMRQIARQVGTALAGNGWVRRPGYRGYFYEEEA